MAEFYILPTTDIHLVLSPDVANGKQFILKLRLKSSGTIDPSLVTVTDYDTAKISVTKNLTNATNPHFVIEALGVVGKTILRITYKDVQSSNKEKEQECFVRVWIHDNISQIWLGNNKVTINRGNTYHGYVVSTFAKFSDNEIGDITYHPYLIYSEDDPKYLTISDHILKSTASAALPELLTELTVTVRSGIYATVPVTIKQAYDLNREILEKIHVGAAQTEHINLLIMGDGFKTKADFILYRNQLVDDLLSNPMFSPWNLIAENLTIWSAFEPTNDDKEGIIINNPINTYNSYMPDFEGDDTVPKPNFLDLEQFINVVGLPDNNTPTDYVSAKTFWLPQINDQNLQKEIFDEWIKYNTLKGYIEIKDTVLGSFVGERLGDKVKSHYTFGNPRALNNWYKASSQQRTMNFDRRRYPQDDHKPACAIDSTYERINNSIIIDQISPLDSYLGSLKYISPTINPPQTGPEYDMGKTWQSIGKDSKFVAIICNHTKWGGTAIYSTTRFKNPPIVIEPRIVFGTLDGEWKYKINTNPSLPAKLDDSINAKNHFNPSSYDSLLIANLFSHELMHAFGLADEYEGDRYSQSPSEKQAKDTVDVDANVSSIYKIIWPGTNPTSKFIDADRIKWNLPRVALSSMIVNDAIRNGSSITVKLEPNQSIKWKNVLDYRDANNNLITIPLYIRSSVFDKDEPKLFYQIPITRIISVDTSTENIVLEISSSTINNVDVAKLKKGSHIFLPKRLNDDFDPSNPELSIINPRVFEYIKSTKKPFAVNSSCNSGSDDPEFPDSDEKINTLTIQINPAYPEFSSPQNRFLVQGIYEGGSEWNCMVYRANGWSILRRASLTYSSISRVENDNNEVIDEDIPYIPPANQSNIGLYSRFDFVAKYYLTAIAYPTKLEDLDRLEYKHYDSSVL